MNRRNFIKSITSALLLLAAGCSSLGQKKKSLVTGQKELINPTYGWMNAFESRSPYKFRKRTTVNWEYCLNGDSIGGYFNIFGMSVYGYNLLENGIYKITIGRFNARWSNDVLGHEVAHNHWRNHSGEAHQYGVPKWYGSDTAMTASVMSLKDDNSDNSITIFIKGSLPILAEALTYDQVVKAIKEKR